METFAHWRVEDVTCCSGELPRKLAGDNNAGQTKAASGTSTDHVKSAIGGMTKGFPSRPAMQGRTSARGSMDSLLPAPPIANFGGL
eukprot:4470311-Alexandrium_andersonii.AAC.1